MKHDEAADLMPVPIDPLRERVRSADAGEAPRPGRGPAVLQGQRGRLHWPFAVMLIAAAALVSWLVLVMLARWLLV